MVSRIKQESRNTSASADETSFKQWGLIFAQHYVAEAGLSGKSQKKVCLPTKFGKLSRDAKKSSCISLIK